jgi:uncharacterized protein YjbI with pentapeptide repeats
MKVGLLHRMFSFRSEYYFGVEALLYTDFRSGALGSEIGMWSFLAEELPGMTVDDALPKTRGEFLVRGYAHPPGGTATTCPVIADVGGVHKTLYVIGDRRWERGTPTEPQPFERMPITWDRAFGGAGFARNPLGVGFAPVETEDGSRLHALPNVETPGHLVDSTRDRPEPASFMPIDFSWPQRLEKAGTYDQRWLEERFPGYADDIDWTIFNAAPPDQWAPGPWAPDTPFSFTHLHPRHPKVEGRLPGYVARAFAVWGKTVAGGQRWEEIPLRLSTLWFFPHQEKVILGFTGAVKCAADDGSDVDWVLLAAEHAGRPKPEEHYRRVMAEREGVEPEAMLASFRESDLLPEGVPSELEEALQYAEAVTPEQLVRRNAVRGAIADWEEMRQRCLAEGVDPDEYLGPCPFGEEDLGPPPKMSIEAALQLAVEQRAEAEGKGKQLAAERDAAQADLRKQVEALGVDVDAEMARAEAQVPPGAPVQRAEDTLREELESLARFRELGMPQPDAEAQITDPRHFAELQALERQQIEAYRAAAHLGDRSLAGIAPKEVLDELRARLVDELRTTRDLSERDLTGVDFSGLDLSGVSFRGAFLEHASFAGARCHDTDFREAVLVRTRWNGASLARTQLAQANLGRADLRGIVLEGPIDLKEAILEHARLARVAFGQSRLDGVTLSDTTLEDVDFAGIQASRITFRNCRFVRVRFTGALLDDGDFDECVLEGLDFAGSSIARLTFLKSRVIGCSFAGSRATGLKAVQASVLEDCDFAECELSDAYLRDAAMSRSRFAAAVLDRADLTDCVLEGASFVGARGRQMRLTRANLTDARLHHADLLGAWLDKADLRGADLRGANLFGVDFGAIVSDARTDVTGAHATRMKLLPKRKTT